MHDGRQTVAKRPGGLGWRTVALLTVASMMSASNAPAASIAIHQDVVTSNVTRRLFTDNGRRMLTGSIPSCNYAYLERPSVTLRDGRLFLRMQLIASAGISVRGACKGAGDSFVTTVSGQPFVTADSVGLRDFRLDEGREMYRGLLDPLLRRQIPSLLGVNLRDELTRAFQSHTPDFKVTLSQLQLQDAVARDGYLTVHFDFAVIANEASK